MRKLHHHAGASLDREINATSLVEQRQFRSVIEDIVADVFDVEVFLLRRASRGRANVALARQVAMYVAHVGYGLSLTEVGGVFERDRTTVSHACTVVELKREDLDFDAALQIIEGMTRVMNAVAHRPGSPGEGSRAVP